MAIVTKNPSGLKLRFDCGINDLTGKSIVKSRTFSNVRPNASNEDVYNVGVALASLQKYEVLEILKIDNATLSQ